MKKLPSLEIKEISLPEIIPEATEREENKSKTV